MRAVGAIYALMSADYNRTDDVALLYRAAGSGAFDGGNYDVTYIAAFTERTAEHPDTHKLLCSAVVRGL